MRLTDMSIKALKIPGENSVIYPDDTLIGFGVRVTAKGAKSFVLTHGVRRQRETIGRVGVIGLQEARNDARRRLAEYTLGKQKPFAIAWDIAKHEYLAEKARKLKPRTHTDYTYELNRHFRYGSTKLCDLTPHDLCHSLDRLQDTPAEQQHAFVVLRAFMRWAHRRHYVDRNPMERMQAPHPYRPRERILSTDELRQVWRTAGDTAFGRIVKLLILTGQRKGEITVLTGGMVGNDTLTVPSWLAKNRREHTIPLGGMAKEILCPPIDADRHFFQAVGKTTPFNGHAVCKMKLDKRSGVYNWTLHDLRRTFASGMASIGVPIPVIERLLNHVSGSFGGIVGVYQRYDYMPEMKEAITRWERHLADLVREPVETNDSVGAERSAREAA